MINSWNIYFTTNFVIIGSDWCHSHGAFLLTLTLHKNEFASAWCGVPSISLPHFLPILPCQVSQWQRAMKTPIILPMPLSETTLSHACADQSLSDTTSWCRHHQVILQVWSNSNSTVSYPSARLIIAWPFILLLCWPWHIFSFDTVCELYLK